MEPTHGKSSSPRKHILLVEDEALIAMSEKLSLERYGYDVVTACTGEQAVDFFQTGGVVNLVLMDIDLGSGIDGTQAAEIILRDQEIPIVFLSSHTEPEIVEKTEKITSYGYVEKSSSITVLDASIKMAFRLFDANRKLTDELVGRKRMEEALQESEEKFRALFEKGPIGVAYHRMEYDDSGRAIDYLFLDANSSYIELTGVDPRGKYVTEAFPGIEDDPFDWIGTFGRVAKTGQQVRFEQYLQPNNRWYDCVGYQVKPDHFVAAFVEITKRKQAEEALKASVMRYDELSARIPVGVYVLWIRANGRKEFEYVSDRWCMIHGLHREDVIADAGAVDGLVHPDDRERFIERNRESARNWIPFLWEGRFFKGDGELLHLRIESTPEVFENGDVRWFGITQDITERQRLQRTTELQARLLQNIGQAAIATDLQGTVVYWNQMAETLYGWSSRDAIGRNVLDVTPTSQTKEQADNIMKKLVQGEEWSGEFTVQRKDGSSFPAYVINTPVFNDEGSLIGVIGISTDITERKRDEERLRNVQAMNRALFDQALGAVYIADMSGKLIDVNRGACSQSGYSREELLDMTVFDLNAPDADPREADRESLLDAWRKWVPGDHHIREATHVGKDGRRYPVLISTGVIQLGNTKAVAGTVLDITERKHAEEQIRTLVAEKETLIREIQHRVKNNISTMMSFLSLQAQTLEEPTAIAALDDARKRLHSLGVLYDQLSAANAYGEASLRQYLEKLVAREVDLFPLGDHVEVHSEIQECLCTTETLSILGLIMNELVTNAMKYAFVNHPSPHLTITGVRRDEHYTLTIEDNGPGVLERDETQVSSGFGLIIVDTLAEQLGGTIRYEEDSGMVAILEFPVGEDR